MYDKSIIQNSFYHIWPTDNKLQFQEIPNNIQTAICLIIKLDQIYHCISIYINIKIKLRGNS